METIRLKRNITKNIYKSCVEKSERPWYNTDSLILILFILDDLKRKNIDYLEFTYTNSFLEHIYISKNKKSINYKNIEEIRETLNKFNVIYNTSTVLHLNKIIDIERCLIYLTDKKLNNSNKSVIIETRELTDDDYGYIDGIVNNNFFIPQIVKNYGYTHYMINSESYISFSVKIDDAYLDLSDMINLYNGYETNNIKKIFSGKLNKLIELKKNISNINTYNSFEIYHSLLNILLNINTSDNLDAVISFNFYKNRKFFKIFKNKNYIDYLEKNNNLFKKEKYNIDDSKLLFNFYLNNVPVNYLSQMSDFLKSNDKEGFDMFILFLENHLVNK